MGVNINNYGRGIPPERQCGDCKRYFRAWSGLRCKECMRKFLDSPPPEESLRDFRKRLHGG